MDPEEIDKRFNHHPPGPDKVRQHEAIRYAYKQLALTLADVHGESREKSLAMTQLEQSLFWANAHIARNL